MTLAATSFLASARAFAEQAHAGQVRKYTGVPYITHPVAVAEIVSTVVKETDIEAVAAAYLHDVIEDCGVKVFDLHKRFGGVVAEYVWLLSIDKNPDKTRAVRKAEYRDRMSQAPKEVQTIKLADMLHNVPDILTYDPDFAKVWVGESLAMLQVLKAGNLKLQHQLAEALK